MSYLCVTMILKRRFECYEYRNKNIRNSQIKKMKIETLSQKSGVPISTLKKILSGVTKDPQIDTIKAIARALECTLEDFDDNSNLKNYSAVEKKISIRLQKT